MNKRVVALGTFDGLHRGHARLIERAISEAKARGLEPLIYTFSNHPRELFGATPAKLMTDACRIAALGRYAEVAAVPFDRALAATPPKEFAREMAQKYGMAVAVAGFNYTFGDRGAGNMELLAAFGRELGFGVCEIPPLLQDGEPISSTRIRESVQAGRVEEAARMLGREYSLSGVVVQNKRIGRRIGFPTANITPPEELALPGCGVYATRACIGGREYRAVTNIGSNPTVEGDHITVETHLIGFDESIYGETLTVRFAGRLRGDVRFASVGELSAQIGRDIEKATEILGK